MGFAEILSEAAAENDGREQVETVRAKLENASQQTLQDAFSLASCPTFGPGLVQNFAALRSLGLVGEDNGMPDDVREAVKICVEYVKEEGYRLVPVPAPVVP